MRIRLALFAFLASVAPAFSSEHPDYKTYEYAVDNYVGTQPSERERIKWECYDDRVKASLSCTFVRGSLDKFRYIYRRKEVEYSVYDPQNPCFKVNLDLDKLLFQDAEILQDSIDASNAEKTDSCDDLYFDLKTLDVKRHLLKLSKRFEALNCESSIFDDIDEEVDRAESDAKDDEHFCASDRRYQAFKQKQAQQKFVQKRARQPSFELDPGLFSDGTISCFGGCQAGQTTSRGSTPTITGEQYGDKRGPDTNGQTGNAR